MSTQMGVPKIKKAHVSQKKTPLPGSVSAIDGSHQCSEFCEQCPAAGRGAVWLGPCLHLWHRAGLFSSTDFIYFSTSWWKHLHTECMMTLPSPSFLGTSDHRGWELVCWWQAAAISAGLPLLSNVGTGWGSCRLHSGHGTFALGCSGPSCIFATFHYLPLHSLFFLIFKPLLSV